MGIFNKKKFHRNQEDALNFTDVSVLTKINLLVDMLRDYFSGEYTGISKAKVIMLIAGIVYIISPFDFIPEFIVGLGFLDDVVLASFILKKVEGALRDYSNWRGIY